MKSKSNIFWGAMLVAFGFLFLGLTNDWFQFAFSIKEIAKYWPIMIILAGIAVLFNENKTIFNPTTALLIAFAILLGIYNATSNTVNDLKSEINEDFNFNYNDDDDMEMEENFGNMTDSLDNNQSTQKFAVSLDNTISEATLELGGGAAEFHLEESDAVNLFQADTKLNGSKFKLEDEKKGNKHEIVFKMKSKNNSNDIRLGKNSNNDVYLKLSKKPVWEIDMNVGASDLQFDLSTYKIKKLDLETGAANMDLKLGGLMKESNIKVNSGVARIKISVPKEVACEIEMDGALNAKDFDGFVKSESGKWRSENYDASKNKINIKLSSGLSALSIDRY
jgi:Domain of unknown function (DUF5668)